MKESEREKGKQIQAGAQKKTKIAREKKTRAKLNPIK
jgi:hypothetical protein